MKKLLLLILFLPLFSSAQKKPKDTAKVILPTKDGMITYQTIIDSLQLSKTDLYNNSLKWLANTFVDSKEVIQIKDPVKGEIVGSGIFDYVAPGFIGGAERMSFMVELSVRDKKARITLYQFRYMYLGSSSNKRLANSNNDYHPLDSSYSRYLQEKQFPLSNKKYFALIDLEINKIVDSYVKFIKGAHAKDEF